MKLFLASQGIQPEATAAFFALFPKPPAELRIAFVPTAADPYENQWFVEATRNDIRRLGIAELIDVDLKAHTAASLRETLSNVDAVFVNGGNTFYLLDWVRKSGFDVVLPELLAQGKVYAGISAGSIIVGPNVALAAYGPSGDPNDIGLTDLDGLSLVSFVVWPHLTNEECPHVIEGAKTVAYPVAAINDAQAIIVDNDALSLIGPGNKLLLNGFITECPTCNGGTCVR